MKLPPKLVDANVILRFFLADDQSQSERACVFMESLEFGREEALLTDVIFAEVVWVLAKVYGVARVEIAAQFGRVIEFVGVKTVYDKAVFRAALQSYTVCPADIQDCLLAALAGTYKAEVVTFDRKDFKKLGCRFREP
ncbi:MAG TPA: PIN domain-containing protein [Desulfuromonadaceae bacterium]